MKQTNKRNKSKKQKQKQKHQTTTTIFCSVSLFTYKVLQCNMKAFITDGFEFKIS